MSVFFLQEVLMTVDAAMVINIFFGLPGMRNMELALPLPTSNRWLSQQEGTSRRFSQRVIHKSRNEENSEQHAEESPEQTK